MTKNLIKIFCVMILLTSCGFKVSQIEKLSTYYIAEVTSTGDYRINYRLKNIISQNTMDISKKPALININTVKSKSIKEKNIKNEITKYNLSIEVNVDITTADKKIIKSFSRTSSGSYDVETRYSDTSNNEKKLIENLSNNLAPIIQERIVKILNNK